MKHDKYSEDLAKYLTKQARKEDAIETVKLIGKALLAVLIAWVFVVVYGVVLS
jgi:hypothetical protein